MQRQRLAIVILAAGKGSRMKSALPKVLHRLSQKPLLSYVLKTARELNPERIIVVVGHQAKQVKEAFSNPGVQFVEQKEQLGTGHAVMQTSASLNDFEGEVLVLCGDMPLIKGGTLKHLISRHRESSATCTLLTLKTGESKDFGRILRNASGEIQGIVENKDATEEQKTIDEYNAGVYCFDKKGLFEAVGQLGNDNSQKEYYLTDAIQYFIQNRLTVQSVLTHDTHEIFGINSEKDLKNAEAIMACEPSS